MSNALFKIFLGLLVTQAFKVIMPGDPVIGFPFFGMKLSAQNYVYYLGEHISVVLYASAMVDFAKRLELFVIPMTVFFTVQIIDTLLYMLSYSQPWFYVTFIPVSWNLLGVFIFGGSIVYDAWKSWSAL